MPSARVSPGLRRHALPGECDVTTLAAFRSVDNRSGDVVIKDPERSQGRDQSAATLLAQSGVLLAAACR